MCTWNLPLGKDVFLPVVYSKVLAEREIWLVRGRRSFISKTEAHFMFFQNLDVFIAKTPF